MAVTPSPLVVNCDRWEICEGERRKLAEKIERMERDKREESRESARVLADLHDKVNGIALQVSTLVGLFQGAEKATKQTRDGEDRTNRMWFAVLGIVFTVMSIGIPFLLRK